MSTFPQGKISDKSLAKRCKKCKKYMVDPRTHKCNPSLLTKSSKIISKDSDDQ